MKSEVFTLITTLLLGSNVAQAFYIPKVNPQNFAAGDVVKLKVNKMTSAKSLLPVDYYSLPFCQPEGGPKLENQNLGEFLAGDRIQSSPYRIKLKKEMFCEQLCITNVGRGKNMSLSPSDSKIGQAIQKDYRNNWIIDNLPAASKTEDDTVITTRYWQGFPIGFSDYFDNKEYINNHVNIELMYHPVETENEKYRIVRFTIEPFSIKHNFKPLDDDDSERDGDSFAVAKIINPIPSCDLSQKEKVHTNYKMAKAGEAQLASGQVLFTYDVTWRENSELHWASRWDIYLSMDDAILVNEHWLSIANSLVNILALTVMIGAILIRNLRRDFARYNLLYTSEDRAEDLEEFGWRLLHGDGFRPPRFSPLVLSAVCGTGAQILCTSFLTSILSLLGFFSPFDPENRGSLRMAGLLLYVMTGGIAGYVTARVYKTFKAERSQYVISLTAFGFPGIGFGLFLFCLIDFQAVQQGSTYAVPFSYVIALLVFWFGISTPLVFLGAYFGYKQNTIEFPMQTSSAPRQIPDQPWFMSIPFGLAIGGIGACFVEMFFIMASVWMGTIPERVLWLSISNRLVIVIMLTAKFASNLLRNLRRVRYLQLSADVEETEDLEEFGWKMVHGDVFRPPRFSPLLLSVACGTGAQILCTSFLTIIFTLLGFLSPKNRGALLMAGLLLYVMMGGIAGYVTARLHKTFKGKRWQYATSLTAFGFPGISFFLFFLMDLLAVQQGSTYAVPFSSMVVLLTLWFGISTPLVFWGAYFGYKQNTIEFPMQTSSAPRQIPDQPWYRSIPFALAIGGIFPFGTCFVENYFIMASVWKGQYYYTFGFLLLVYFILIIACAEITVLCCYFQLCGENYYWWWRSFCTSGSTALYIFIYSFVYFHQLEANNSFATYVLYFGYMALVSFGLFLMTGFIGVFSSLYFTKKLYASIKTN